jgi:hypothetical protein
MALELIGKFLEDIRRQQFPRFNQTRKYIRTRSQTKSGIFIKITTKAMAPPPNITYI